MTTERARSGVALVGIGCRLPGHSNSPEELWQFLCRGGDAISEIPDERFDVQRFYDPDPSRPGRLYVKRAGIADNVGRFDASFFGISQREAAQMDPQQRMLLEVAWEALEDAGIPAERIAGTRAGVYVGISSHDFASRLARDVNRNRIESHTLTGTASSIAANRLSYAFDLRGPSMAIDTACSSSLTAVYLACRSLSAGECELALAGGVNLFLAPETAISMAKASMLSPDGRSRAFDARADGYVRGEGAGVVVLKPLEAALRDRDRIYAIVRGSAVNQDGRTLGLTVPSANAQACMIREALREADVSPAEVQYVEAHGTGTPIGDPIEAAAIGEVFGERDADSTCIIGSVKTNIGHLEAAAGIAGLIKASLALKHGVIPPSLNFETWNPAIPFDRLRLRVATELQPWPTAAGRRMAAVNSFGVGGANAHVLLEGPPPARDAGRGCEGPHVLLLSAKTVEARSQAVGCYATFLRNREAPLSDICYSAAVRRTHHQHRMAVVGGTAEELANRLEAGATDVIAGSAPHGSVPKLAFVYSGMGLQRAGMGRELLRSEPVFREVLETCDALLQRWAGWSLLHAFEDDDEARASEPAVAQVTNFALQAALTNLWSAWGVVPDAVIGHSVGEVAAAYAAGALSLEDGLRLAYHRGRLAQRLHGTGSMLVAAMSAAQATALLSGRDSHAVLAAVNSPTSVTLSGDAELLSEIAAGLEQQQVFARFVPVNVPYHGPALDPFREELLDSLRTLAPQRLSIPMVSTASGEWVNGVPLEAGHWWNELRNPVQFARALDLLIEDRVELFLEVGPHFSLKAPISECLAHRSRQGTVLSSLRRGEDDRASMLRAAANLHVRGRPVAWSEVFPRRGSCTVLPLYPWQRELLGTGWVGDDSACQAAGTESGHPLLGVRIHSARPCWQVNLAEDRYGYLDGHLVQDAAVVPAAAYVEASLEAAAALWPDTGGHIEQIEFRTMLVLPAGRASWMQWTCDTDGAFEIFSAPHTDASWTAHAAGRLRRRSPSECAGGVELSAIRARCTEEIPLSDWYEWYARRGLHYRGPFRGVEAVWRGRGEALARISVSEDATGYRIHPCLLDAAFQVLGAAVPARVDGAGGSTLLPASASVVRWYGPSSVVLWAHSTLRKSQDNAFEGDIRLLDDDGRIVAVVERLRCLLIGEQRISADGDSLLYRVRWQTHMVERSRHLESPARVIGPAAEAAERNAAATSLAAYTPQVEALLNKLAAAFILAARRRLCEAAGLDVDEEIAPQRLGVDPRYHRLFHRLMEIAEAFPSGSTDAEGCRRMAASLREAHPGVRCMVDLLSTCGESLDAVLTGKLEAPELLFSPDSVELLSDFYCKGPVTSYYSQSLAEVVEEIARTHVGTAKLRILELGAGTGGTTAFVLSRLEKVPADYVFTDISPFFLTRARECFGNRPHLHFAVLDIETGRSEGLPHAEFDVIVAADMLHTARNVAGAIRNVRRWLAPGGLLVLIEPIRITAWMDVVFGPFPGWWRPGEQPGRLVHSCLSSHQWTEVLASEDLDEIAVLPVLECEHPRAQTLFVARRAQGRAKEWLILGDQQGAGEQIAKALGRRGDAVHLVRDRLSEDVGTRAWAGVIHCASLDQPLAQHLTASALLDYQTGTYAELVTALRRLSERRHDLPPIWLVTAGAQAAAPGDLVPNTAQSGLWGLGRVLGVEFPGSGCRLADLSPTWDVREIEALADCIANHTPEDELAFRGDECFVGRVEPATRNSFRDDVERVAAVESAQVRLEVGEVGSLESLSLREARPARPGSKELLIRVHAAGLNFRDIMLTLGLLPVGEPIFDSRFPLGFECSGVVCAVGDSVRNFKPGDEVIAVTHGAFASHAIVRAAAAVSKPASMSFEDAATILAAFTTVQHGLHHLARIAPGERVLIHSATGGVGLAAIQMCRAVGAEIFATAGSPEKRALLRSMGIAHVMDSRSLSFADEVLTATGGEGVDVVLNSLPGEAISRGLSILRPEGRFVELGKRDLLDNTRVGLEVFEKTLSFFTVDLDRMFCERTEKVGELAAEVMAGFADGRYHPLPRTDYPLSEAAAAFRCMSQAKHVGKIVLTAREAQYRVKPTRAQQLFRNDATYLITGGLGGFGLVVAKWLVAQGARHLVLMGRQGIPSAANQADYEQLLRTGADVRILTGDVSLEADVTRVLAEIHAQMPSLGGVFHAAMALADKALLELTADDWRCALAPKVCGAWLLHRLTEGDKLDCFVMFSSAASIVGSSMQGNYAAANAYLDALAHHRRARGLAGVSICWGILSGAGYVSRQPEVRRYLEHIGLRGISVTEALDALEVLLRGDQAHAIVGRIDWSVFWRSFSAGARRFSALPGVRDVEPAGQGRAEAGSALAEFQQAEPSSRREAAHNYVLRRIAGVLTEPESKLDADAPLTSFGLDSLMAVELQTLFHADLGIRIPATRFLQGVTVRGLTDLILARLDEEQAPLQAPAGASPGGTGEQILPLAREQRRLWFLQQLHPHSPVYNIPLAMRLQGDLNVALLEQAIREMTQRHEALRATVIAQDGKPVQRISRRLDLRMEQVDLSALPGDSREAEVSRYKREEAELPFAFDGGPLIRARLLRIAARDHVLLVTIHHLIVDAWSVAIIARDHALIYRQLIAGHSPAFPAAAPGYADFIVRQASHDDSRQLEYWTKQLDGVVPLRLATDRRHPPQRTFNGARVELPMERETLDRLERCGRTEGATLFMTLLAAFEVLLYRYSGQGDFCVGAPVAARAREEAMDRVGCLVNTLAIRAGISGDMTFRELLRSVRDTVLDAYAHQDVTWEKVVEALHPERDPASLPIFQVLLVVHRVAVERAELPGLVIVPEYTGNRSTTFDVVLLIDTARREAAIEYNTDIFDAATIERMSGHLRELWAAIPDRMDTGVHGLPLLTKAERQQLLVEWNATASAWPKDRCLHHLFEAQTQRTPDAIAVTDALQSLTYMQLNRAANRLASALQARGVGPESRVAICAGRSPLAVVGIVAILKAGGAFVPVDPSYPDDRLAFMLRDSAPGLVLTELQLADRLKERFSIEALPIDLAELLRGPEKGPEPKGRAENLAYLMYTSGSTGQPKGVMIEHRAICNQIQWRQGAFALGPDDAVLLSTSLSFDPSVWEIFGPLSAGAAVVIPDRATDGEAVRRMIRDHRVTVLEGVPSLLRSLVEQGAFHGCDSVRHIFCGGEPLENDLIEALHATSRASVHQLYGCTEASIDATFIAAVDPGQYSVPPVGRPIANTRIYVLDEFFQPVPCGVPGEVYVSGAGIARGYWNQPELTASCFPADPFADHPAGRMYRTGDRGRFLADGCVELVGRSDRQIKLRGLRIEPGEVEASLRRHPSIREAVVDVRTVSGEARLIAWCALAPGKSLTAAEAGRHARQHLPRSMVPQHWVFVDGLPLTPVGKVNVSALPEPAGAQTDSKTAPVAATSQLQRRIAQIWEDALAARSIGVDDNFFDMGGHSLLAAWLANRLSCDLGVNVPVAAIFNNPTIAELAQFVAKSDSTGA